MAELRFFPRVAGRSDDDYRHDILEALIAQALRYPRRRALRRAGHPEGFDRGAAARDPARASHRPPISTPRLPRAELTLGRVARADQTPVAGRGVHPGALRAAHLRPNEEIADYYNGTWRQQRRERGLADAAAHDVREEIRTLIRSRQLDSRSRRGRRSCAHGRTSMCTRGGECRERGRGSRDQGPEVLPSSLVPANHLRLHGAGFAFCIVEVEGADDGLQAAESR